jgi:branched-chain amino acid transport system permease protein
MTVVDLGTLVDAITIGSVYGLVALGFTIIFASTHVINFAQGEFVILGAAVAFQTQSVWGWNPIAMVLTAIVFAIAMGVVTERMIMLPVRLSGSRYAWIISTLAAALIFQAVFGLLFPSALLKPERLIGGGVIIFGARLEYQELIVIVAALLIMGLYDQFLRRTIYGRAMRATAHNPDIASLMGIGVRGVVVVSFVFSAVITTLAGVLTAPTIFIEPGQGLLFTVKGFVAIVIGGIGSFRGALVGGLLVGVLDTAVRNNVSAGVSNMVVVALLAVILLIFPAGLFGKPIEGH